MTEPNPSSHWESLISSLGATPPDEEETLRQPDPKETPPATEKPVPVERSPQPPADWDNIAGELGIEAPPQNEVPPPKEDPLADLFPPSEAPVESPRQVTVTPESGDESPNFFDEKFDFEEPFDLLESGKPTAETPEPEESADEPADKRPRKRRRRRRPAKGDKSEQAAESIVEPGIESDKTDLDEEQSSEKRRSKRRRPSRGKKRRPTEGKQPNQRTESSDTERPETTEEADSRDEDEGNERRDDRSVRAGFRSIPTWSEAVGLLIDKNLEGRASRPSGQQRGRGKKRRS